MVFPKSYWDKTRVCVISIYLTLHSIQPTVQKGRNQKKNVRKIRQIVMTSSFYYYRRKRHNKIEVKTNKISEYEINAHLPMVLRFAHYNHAVYLAVRPLALRPKVNA